MTNQPPNAPWNNYPIAPQPAPKRRRRWPWITGGAVVLLIVVAAIAGNGGPAAPTGTQAPALAAAPSDAPSAPAFPASSSAGDPRAATNFCPAGSTNVNDVCVADTTTTDTPSVPPQEQEAIGSAQDYLSFAAFSRQGLIDQLSSTAGDGYPVDVATAAVDSLDADWNAQAAKSAENYLGLTHFSCSGLISQLDSSAGEKFTKAQATYGAHQTSACG